MYCINLVACSLLCKTACFDGRYTVHRLWACWAQHQLNPISASQQVGILGPPPAAFLRAGSEAKKTPRVSSPCRRLGYLKAFLGLGEDKEMAMEGIADTNTNITL